MNIVLWIIIGSFFGVVLSKKDKSSTWQANTMMLGLCGAIAGGLVASMLGNISPEEFHFHTLLVSFAGAATLVWIGKSVI
jgi:uncharacterized membrane protein YeaQ/YmgE (transglycosylase-associated protein family)